MTVPPRQTCETDTSNCFERFQSDCARVSLVRISQRSGFLRALRIIHFLHMGRIPKLESFKWGLKVAEP